MAVEIETSEAPDLQQLASGAAVAAMTGYFTPLTKPAGATDLKRSIYKDPLQIWTFGRDDPGERKPGIVFVHGGGWGGGAPAFHLRHAYLLAEHGFVSATIEYRYTVTDPWPAQIEDVTAAIEWMRANADSLGLDPNRLAVAGGSAGGHLAVMAALTVPDMKAAVVWYPAVDLRSFHNKAEYKPMTDALMPGASVDDLYAASPVAHVGPSTPPVLTFTGDLDAVTTVADIEVFHELLDDAGVRNELVVFKGRDHGFDYHPTDFDVCVARMTAFLDDVL